MTLWDILHLVAILLSILATVGVLRNPLRTLLNTLAGTSYAAGAVAAFLLDSWWPLLAGWVLSLTLQAIMTRRMAQGRYNEKINAHRAARGLHSIADSNGKAEL